MPQRDVAGQAGRAAGSALRIDVVKPGTVLMHSWTSADLARACACRPLVARNLCGCRHGRQTTRAQIPSFTPISLYLFANFVAPRDTSCLTRSHDFRHILSVGRRPRAQPG